MISARHRRTRGRGVSCQHGRAEWAGWGRDGGRPRRTLYIACVSEPPPARPHPAHFARPCWQLTPRPRVRRRRAESMGRGGRTGGRAGGRTAAGASWRGGGGLVFLETKVSKKTRKVSIKTRKSLKQPLGFLETFWLF